MYEVIELIDQATQQLRAGFLGDAAVLLMRAVNALGVKDSNGRTIGYFSLDEDTVDAIANAVAKRLQ
jgi:hypothetical protein